MPGKTFTITIDVDEFMTEFVPKVVRQYIKSQTPDDAPDGSMIGTTITIDVDVSGDVYSYSVTDGVALDVLRGKLEAPMLFLSVSVETLVVLAKMKYVDILLGIQSRFTRESYDILCDLAGTAVFHMNDPDGNPARIRTTFNNARTPETVLRLSLEDGRRFTAGKVSAEELFESGQLVVEGDMDFAVNLQRLFS